MHVRLLVPVVMLCGLAVLVATQLPGESAASTSLTVSADVAKAVTVIESDVGMSQKLRAFERLKIKGTADAISELVKLTEHSDARISAAACAALGRVKSDASKGKLKDIIKSTSKSTRLRCSAMNALARHGSFTDRSWLESNTKNDSKLGPQFTVISAKSFWE